MKKMKVSNLKNVRCKLPQGFSLAIVLSLFLTSASTLRAEETESLDINSLRAQLETSRSQANAPTNESKTIDSNPLNDTKKNLDQEEQALMKKLKNVVPEDSSGKEAEIIKDDGELANKEAIADEILPSNEIVPDANALKSEEKEIAKLEVKTKDSPTINSFKNSKNENIAAPKEIAKEKLANKSNEITPIENVKVAGNNKANAELQQRVAALQTRLSDKSKELEETRNRLVIAETQVERLSGILEKMNSQKLAGYMGTEPSTQTARANSNPGIHQFNPPVVNQVSNTKPSEESLVGIVTTQKAFLRSGPSKDDSPIMSVSKGTRLVVETRNNEWYRVITPTGGRAWISTEMLGFGPGSESGSSSALRIGGYEKTLR